MGAFTYHVEENRLVREDAEGTRFDLGTFHSAETVNVCVFFTHIREVRWMNNDFYIDPVKMKSLTQ